MALGLREALLRVALLLCLALLPPLTGCNRSTGQELTDWTLEAPDGKHTRVRPPVHMDDQLPNHESRYRLLTSVQLAPGLAGRDVEFVLPYYPAFVALRVNGEAARVLEDAGPAREFGGSRPRRWLLPTSAAHTEGPLRFELEVTHRWTHSAWFNVAPELVPAGGHSARVERTRLFNEQGAWFGLLALSQVGLTFLAVFFWDRRRRGYLWFAIQALSASYYPAYTLGLPAPFLGWAMQNVLLAQSLAVAPIISVYFSHDLFRLKPPHRIWLVLLALALLSPLSVVIRDYHFHDLSYASPIVVLCVLSGVLYQLTLGVRLLRTNEDAGLVVPFLGCWIALGSSSWVDLLVWAGGPDLLSGARPACVGLGVFGIFQSILLGRAHFRSLAEADTLNGRLRAQVHDLKERQEEIAALNDELRRQIGKRSVDILTALTASQGSTTVSLTAGEVIEARYRVLGPLGSGGMGTVYKVERVGDRKLLALKVPQDIHGLALARLAREAQIATRIDHANVVAIVDADVAQGGFAYLVMELVEGTSLADTNDNQSLAWCLDVLHQVLLGVSALHAQGVIHRDLKPSNILLARAASGGPLVKITDFGISRWLEDTSPGAESHEGTVVEKLAATPEDRTQPDAPRSAEDTVISGTRPARAPRSAGREGSSSPSLTRTGTITGTPLYVAPELSNRAATLSPAVDVFSFGVVAFRLLTGKPPHLEAPLLARLGGRKIASVPPIASLQSQLSEELARALDACLSAAPEERPRVDALIALFEAERAPSNVAAPVLA